MRHKLCKIYTKNLGYPFIRVKTLFFFFFTFNFLSGCAGSSLIRMGFLSLQHAGPTLPCGAQVSHCSGFSCCGAQASGAWPSVVVSCRLSFCAACGIFPDQGLNPYPLHQQLDSYPLPHQGSPRLF